MNRYTYALLLTVLLLTSNVGTAYAIKPSPQYIATPSAVGLEYDSLNITTSDGFRLTAWFCKSKVESANTVVVAGGDAGNMSYHLNVAALIVHSLNVNVLLFDYRGFGSSGAYSVDTNLITHTDYLVDLNSAIGYCKDKKPGKILCYGRSMGAALALACSPDNLISGVVAESPYLSQRELSERASTRYRDAGKARTITYLNDQKLEPHVMASYSSTPVAIVGGSLDTMVPEAWLRELFTLLPGQSKWLFIEGGADHLQLPDKAPYALVSIINSMLEL